MLTALRVANLAIWTALLIYMLAGARSAITGDNLHRSDPMRLGVAAVCLVIILGNLRWLFAPDSDGLFCVIYVLSAAVGLYIARLSFAYGRGPHI